MCPNFFVRVTCVCVMRVACACCGEHTISNRTAYFCPSSLLSLFTSVLVHFCPCSLLSSCTSVIVRDQAWTPLCQKPIMLLLYIVILEAKRSNRVHKWLVVTPFCLSVDDIYIMLIQLQYNDLMMSCLMKHAVRWESSSSIRKLIHIKVK